MKASADEAAHEYAGSTVPDEALGSAWRVFFIVAGSMSGLPTFLLSASVFGALGFWSGLAACAVGAALSGLLGGLSSYSGSRARMGLAVLAVETFGAWGGRVLKLVIAVSLVGWFAVEIAILGATLSGVIAQVTGAAVPSEAISIPFAVAIFVVTSAGATGLELIGRVVVPSVVACLALSLWLTDARIGLSIGPGTGAIGFGAAVSAVVGSYVVGIVIQPDYSRFVRAPLSAGAATASALGLVFPLFLLASALPAVALGQPNLIAAMVVLGLGLPAMAILTMGVSIDTSACLYSGSLPIASELPRVPLKAVLAAVTALSVLMTVLHVETYFIGFLVVLGVSLPPVAAIQVAHVLGRAKGVEAQRSVRRAPFAAWIIGFAAGEATTQGWATLTGLPSLDSILAALAVLGCAELARRLGAARAPGYQPP